MSAPLDFSHEAMATVFTLRFSRDAPESRAAEVAREAFVLLDGLESKLSRYRETSSISRLNRANPGEWVRVDPDTLLCLQIAEQMRAVTAGAFSINSSLEALKISPGTLEVARTGEQEVDLGGIGKGFALDQMASLLREWDWNSALLSAGGSSFLALAAPKGKPGWPVRIQPDIGEAAWINLREEALSASGVGVKGQHVWDARRQQRQTSFPRAWARCELAAVADALTTALLLMNTDERAACLNQIPDAACLLESADERRVTGSLQPRLKKDATGY